MVHRTQGFYFNVRGLLITNDPSVLSKLRKLVESWYSYEWSRKLTFPIWLVERTRWELHITSSFFPVSRSWLLFPISLFLHGITHPKGFIQQQICRYPSPVVSFLFLPQAASSSAQVGVASSGKKDCVVSMALLPLLDIWVSFFRKISAVRSY